MKKWKKICKGLLFPGTYTIALLTPLSVVFILYSMMKLDPNSPIRIFSYIMASYTLCVWCLKITDIISMFKKFLNSNKYAKRWVTDTHIRINTSLCVSLLFNAAYALFHLALGIYHSSFWYYSLTGYYIALAVIRFFLLKHTRRYTYGEKLKEELIRYRICGYVFLILNIVLTVMVFFMIYFEKIFIHHKITAIAMAAYTFFAFTTAIINIITYRKYKSPIYSAAKSISLASACVSMITLTSVMITTFGDKEDTEFRRVILSSTGASVSIFISTMAFYIIIKCTQKIKGFKDGQK